MIDRKRSEEELINLHAYYLFRIENYIKRYPEQFQAVIDDMPEWIHVNDYDSHVWTYLNKNTHDDCPDAFELIKKYGLPYMHSLIKPESTAEIMPILIGFLEADDDYGVEWFFQDIKMVKENKFTRFHTVFKKLNSHHGTISHSVRHGNMNNSYNEIDRLLRPDETLMKYLNGFLKLSKFSKILLKHKMLGGDYKLIADYFNITATNVEKIYSRACKDIDLNRKAFGVITKLLESTNVIDFESEEDKKIYEMYR